MVYCSHISNTPVCSLPEYGLHSCLSHSIIISINLECSGHTSTKAITIGGVSGENNFIGTVADVRIYNDFFDSDKCAELYQAMNE